MKVVKDIVIERGVTADKLINQMLQSGGFTAKKLAVGVDILEAMIRDKNSLNFLSFPASIIATGSRGIIKELIRRNFFDVVITTCGTLDHDLSRSFKNYYHGSFEMDDKELHRRGINRLGNILIPNRCHGALIEKKMRGYLERIYKRTKELSTAQLCWKLGQFIGKEDSILYWCYKRKIPMIVPGIADGAVGYQIWAFSQDHDLKINILEDEQLLSDLVWSAQRLGALVIGGGISKHHVIWWGQFGKGLDRAVYITTAPEHDGSLSGARPREAVSWGKIKEKASTVIIESDATLALPLILAALLERLERD